MRFNPITGQFELPGIPGPPGGGTPGGSDTQLQFNDGGTLEGIASLTWNSGASTLELAGTLEADGLTLNHAATSGVANFDVSNLTGERSFTMPDATGTMALQEWVTTQLDALVAAAPGALDTLNELAAALGDDANFASTVTTALAGKGGLTSAQTWTAANVFNIAPRVPRTDLAGGTALTIGTYYQDSIGTDRTLTFSGSPAEGSTIHLKLLVTAVCVLTVPSSKRMGEANSAITTLQLTPGNHALAWLYVDGEWTLSDTVGTLHKLDATTAPGTGDDSADGYSVGSLWLDTTNDVAYICLDATASAAVWRKITTTASDSETLTNKIYSLSVPGTDDAVQGTIIAGLNAGATIAQWEAVYMGSGGEWLLADANGTGTYPARGLAVAAGTDNNAMSVLTSGIARNDAWAWTVGGTIYLSTTAGGLTQTAPSGSGEHVQVMGFALSADAMFVQPSPDYITLA
jgi:hypothetical protein